MAIWIEAVGFMATSIEVCSSGCVCEKEFLPRAWGAEPVLVAEQKKVRCLFIYFIIKKIFFLSIYDNKNNNISGF